jgi:molecular chaperone GrpE
MPEEDKEEVLPVQPEGEKGKELPVEEDIESLTKALAEEKERAERYLANWQRAQADLINFKKRSEQEKEEIIKFANAMLVMNLLPIIDDLERALDNVSIKLAGLTCVDGIRLIHRKLQAVLESHGVCQIEALGSDFDPTLHEAVLEEEGEEGKVIEELQKGYKLHERVLRPAMVKVGKGKEC